MNVAKYAKPQTFDLENMEVEYDWQAITDYLRDFSVSEFIEENKADTKLMEKLFHIIREVATA